MASASEAGTITIVSPNADSDLNGVDTVDIKWESTDLDASTEVIISYEIPTGISSQIAEVDNSGEYLWVLPQDFDHTGVSIVIEVGDTNIRGEINDLSISTPKNLTVPCIGNSSLISAWDIATDYLSGSIVMLNGAIYWAAFPSTGVNPSLGIREWIECDCEDFALVWSPNDVYSQFSVIEYPAGSLQYYISSINSNSYIPDGNFPEKWAPCDGEKCSEANGYGGPWYDQLVSNGAGYMDNDVVEYPAGSGDFYISTSDNNIHHPMSQMNWTLCTCSELYDGVSVATQWSIGNPITINGFDLTHYTPVSSLEHLIVKINGELFIFLLSGGSEPIFRKCSSDNCMPPLETWNIANAAAGFYDYGVLVKTQRAGVPWRTLWESTVENNGDVPGTSISWQRCIPYLVPVFEPDYDEDEDEDPPGRIERKMGGQYAYLVDGQAFEADLFETDDGTLVLSTTHSQTYNAIVDSESNKGISGTDSDAAGISGPDDETGCFVLVYDTYDYSYSTQWEDPCPIKTENAHEKEAKEAQKIAEASEKGCWVVRRVGNDWVVDGADGKVEKEWVVPCPHTKSIDVDPSYGPEIGCWISATTWAETACVNAATITTDVLPPIVVSACLGMAVGVECGARIVITSNDDDLLKSGVSSSSNSTDVGIAGPGGPEGKDSKDCYVVTYTIEDGHLYTTVKLWSPCPQILDGGDSDTDVSAADNSTSSRSLGYSSGGGDGGCYVLVEDGNTGKYGTKEYIIKCPYGPVSGTYFTLPDGTNYAAYYLLGQTCDDFSLVEGAVCEDAVVKIEPVEVKSWDNGCWIETIDDQGQVLREWVNPCPTDGSVIGSITQRNDSSEIQDGEIVSKEKDSSLPGFTLAFTLSALLVATIITRRKKENL